MLAFALLATCAARTVLEPGRGPAACPVHSGQAQQLGSEEPARTLAGLRVQHARKDWNALSSAARAARARFHRGSDAWFEASALLAEALYQDWNPRELEELGGDVRAAVMESVGAAPGEPFSVLGRLGPSSASCALDVYVLDAWALQARGDLEGAIAELWPVPEIVLHGDVKPSRFTLRAGLDLGRMHVTLGRKEGPSMLAAVRDRFPGSDVSASAMVLLEALEGTAAYRGRYAGDVRHAARLSALRSAVPAARLRVAEALGVPLDELPVIPAGVADRPQGHGAEVAYTEGDPRRPAFPPVVVIFSQALALDLQDPERLLRHEFGHAVLLLRIGVAYERLPPWVREGLSHWIAGEFESLVQEILGARLRSDGAGFAGPEHARLLEPDFGPMDGIPGPEAGLALAYLLHEKGDDGLRRLVGELVRGRALDEALREVSGLSAAEYLAKAREYARELLLGARRASLADLEALAVPMAETALSVARSVHERNPAPFVRGHAALREAMCLEALGRHEEAVEAYRRIVRESRTFPWLAEEARLGLARTLARAGRSGEARSVLLDLRHDALTLAAGQQAEALLATLPR